MGDEDNIEPFIMSSSRSNSSKIYYLLWGALFTVLLMIVILLGYQISLSKALSTKQSGTDTTSQYASLRQEITSAMDFSADPCSDFYQYSCGTLINNIQLGSSSMNIPTFVNITLKNYEIMSDICNDQWPLISDLYQSCMMPNTPLVMSTVTTLKSSVAHMQQSLTDTATATVLSVLASLHRTGVDAFFNPGQFQNIFIANPDINLAFEETQNTAGFDYSNPGDMTELTSDIAQLVGALIPTYTTTNATNAVTVEKALYNLYAPYQDAGFEDTLKAIPWSQFLISTGLNYNLYANSLNLQLQNNDTVLVNIVQYFQGLTSILTGSSQQVISDYLTWRIVYSAIMFPVIPTASASFVERIKANTPKSAFSVIDFEPIKEHLASSSSFTMTKQQMNCIDTVDYLLGDFLGLIFTMKVLDDEVVDGIHTVTGGIQNSFKNNLPGLSWLDEYSKEQAGYKLGKIIQLVGHPNKLDRYRGLTLDPTNFLQNIIAINARVFDDDMSQVGTKFDRSQNEFPATIVNAFYSPDTNTINFPAGILESPFFSTSFPKILQYARMGYVIGHETTHGFDNHGRLWNAFGQYTPIMDNATAAEFTQRAQCIVDQYNKFEPVPNYFVNGEQTLGENIADLGGVKNAYLAYQAWVAANGTADLHMTAKSPIVPTLTNSQLFFVMMAQTWCTKATDAYLIRQLTVDVHSPSMYRVNGPLANLDAFSEAYNCPVGSAMNPSNKCSLW